MKKLSILTATLLVSVAALAAPPLAMVFRTTDGREFTADAANLSMTVSNGTLLVCHAAGEQTFELGKLDKMYFAGSESAISTIRSTECRGEVRVYTPAGADLGSYKSADEAAASLPSGVYLFRTSKSTYKVRAL